MCGMIYIYMYIEQHLVKDQRVLKLVQRLAASEEDGGKEGKEGGTQQSSDDWDELTAYVSCTPSYVQYHTLDKLCVHDCMHQ